MEDLINAIGMPLIVALVPLAVAAIRRILPNIPKPLLPVLAAAIGPVADQAIALLAGVEAIGWEAALLGLAGVGIREVVDQTTKSLGAGDAGRSLKGLAVVALSFMLVGCPDSGLTQNTGNAAVDAYANAVKRVGLACDSYTASLNTLSTMRDMGQLSDETRASVTNVRNQVGPICTQADPPLVLADGRDTIAFIEPLIYQLLIYKGGAP